MPDMRTTQTPSTGTKVAIFLLVVAVWFVLMVLITLLVLAQIQDIQTNGFSFWNVFWLLIAGSAVFGGSSRYSRGRS